MVQNLGFLPPPPLVLLLWNGELNPPDTTDKLRESAGEVWTVPRIRKVLQSHRLHKRTLALDPSNWPWCPSFWISSYDSPHNVMLEKKLIIEIVIQGKVTKLGGGIRVDPVLHINCLTNNLVCVSARSGLQY